MKKINIGVNAHRGVPCTCPENTILSFERAARLPVTAIEFDVHLTRDKQMVVTHDALIDRCSNGHGLVSGFTLAELREFDFGSWKAPEFAGTRIPTLDETVNAIHAINPAMRLLIEIKENNIECAGHVLKYVQAHNLLDKSMLSSFYYDVLAFLRKTEPAVKLHGNDATDEGDPNGVSAIIDSIGIYSRFAVLERILYYKQKGVKVDSWVINDKETLDRVIANGTESVTTDEPELLCRLLGKGASA